MTKELPITRRLLLSEGLQANGVLLTTNSKERTTVSEVFFTTPNPGLENKLPSLPQITLLVEVAVFLALFTLVGTGVNHSFPSGVRRENARKDVTANDHGIFEEEETGV